MSAPQLPREDPAVAHAALFDREASHYDAAYEDASWGGYALRARQDAVLAALGEAPRDVLDAGMGPGQLCRYLAALGWTVSGLDVSPEMVARAREKLPEAEERLVVGDLRALPFADSSFDAVVASGVLDYVPNYPLAVLELARVLRPGGQAVLTMPNPLAPVIQWRRQVANRALRALKRVRPGRRPAPARRAAPPTPRAFTRLLENSGFEVRSLAYTSYCVLPWPLEELLPRLAVSSAERLEGRRRAPKSLCATQTVLAARKVAA